MKDDISWNEEKLLWKNFLKDKGGKQQFIEFLINDDQRSFAKKIILKYSISKDITLTGNDEVTKIEKKNIKTKKELETIKRLTSLSLSKLKSQCQNILHAKITRENKHEFICSAELAIKNNFLIEAVALYHKIIKYDIKNIESLGNLGAVYLILKQYEKASYWLQKVIDIDSTNTNALTNLGSAHRELKKFNSSLYYYKKAYSLCKGNPDILTNIGSIYAAMGDMDEARRLYEKSYLLDDNNHANLTNYGTFLCDNLDYSHGLQMLLRANRIKKSAVTLNNIANIITNYGVQREAQQYLRDALVLDPSYTNAMSNYLFVSNYDPALNSSELYERYKNIAEKVNPRIKLPLGGIKSKFRKIIPGEKIRIGFISGDFNRHAASNFTLPLLEGLSKLNCEIHLYNNSSRCDDITKKFEKISTNFLNIATFPDLELINIIKNSEIDVFIDLSGHTEGNRLPIFKAKPAKVSATWMGYNYTTGLKEIDYFITDRYQVPSENIKFYAEKPLYVGEFFVPYRPLNVFGKCSEPPFIKNKYITFGTLSRGIRINDEIIKTWSQILGSVPNSRLRFDSRSYSDLSVARFLAEKFKSYGISIGRLDFGYNKIENAMADIDIVLDSYPHNSGTTLFECLYNGLPYITRSGELSLSRLGGSLCNAVGLSDLIASSEQGYIEKAMMLANSPERLIFLRENLRKIMTHSVVMDYEKFSENFYSTMLRVLLNQTEVQK